MKLDQIKPGVEYGAVDQPTRRYSGVTPRQVTVLEVVTVAEQYWSGGGYSSYSSHRATRNVRRIKVKVLDNSLATSRYSDAIARAKRGETLVIESRQIVAPWSELAPDIKKRAEEEQARTAKKSEVEAKLKKLGFKIGWGDVEVAVSRDLSCRVEFHDKYVEKLLTKLEASA